MSFLTDALAVRLPRFHRASSEPGLLDRLQAAHHLALCAENGRPLPAEDLRILGIECDPPRD